MSDIRELINPHDEIYLNCDDMDAARLAVLVVGKGAYGINGNGLPVFLLGGVEEWAQETYGVSLSEWMETISNERVIKALESFELARERTSLSDPVKYAHELAEALKKDE